LKLIIAEKPSLGKTIASALGVTGRKDGYLEGNGFIVSWCYGHLYGLYDLEMYINPDYKQGDKVKWTLDVLPFYPEDWKFKYKIANDSGVKKQDKLLNELINRDDIDTIYHAGDADREGEVIVRNELNRYNKSKKKVLRLWLPALTTDAIRDGVANAKLDSEYIGYDRAGRTRASVDWLMGINFTRFLSVEVKTLLNVGRCVCPIVTKIVERDNEIKNFKPVKYLTIASSSEGENGISFTSKVKFKLEESDNAKELAEKYNQAGAKVTDVKTEQKKIKAPKLFSMSDLQSYLCKVDKTLSPQDVLNTVQSLYEKAYLTYPRTSSNFLAQGESYKVDGIISVLQENGITGLVNKPTSKAIYDDSKVESHSAITPTNKIPDLDSLSDKEKLTYNAVKNRFCAVFCADDYLVNRTEIEIVCCDETYKFTGDVVTQDGWTRFETPSKKEKQLPKLNIGDTVPVNFKPVQKETQPPKRYTVASLNNWMKAPLRGNEDAEKEYSDEEWKDILSDATICTEATRADTIDKCIKGKYIALEDGTYYALDKGFFMVDALKQFNINLSPELTVELQRDMHDVEVGKKEPRAVLDKVKALIDRIFEGAKDVAFTSEYTSKVAKSNEKEVIGKCPRCGSPVYEGKLNFYCSKGKDCGFALWKSNKLLESLKTSMTATRAKKMLADGKVHVKGLYSAKKDSKFDAFIAYEDTGKFINYKLEFGKG